MEASDFISVNLLFPWVGQQVLRDRLRRLWKQDSSGIEEMEASSECEWGSTDAEFLDLALWEATVQGHQDILQIVGCCLLAQKVDWTKVLLWVDFRLFDLWSVEASPCRAAAHSIVNQGSELNKRLNRMSSVYQGLVNEGATCYLNSLVQTLFMTYEFRENVYSYIHDPKKIKGSDSIPYQLQKLFVNLQTKDKASYTFELLKSFQWNDHQAFQQHDVQEFCRILFEAIEMAHKNTAWIKQLFEGSWRSYVDCGQHRSLREEMFMDIALPIRNQYTNKTYESIEESLQDFLRPQKLQDKFECDQCGQRVFVEKGMTLGSVPPLLTLQLNRFELNLQTFQREKINSFFYFPEILELHRFMVPFNDIKIKGLPAGLKIKTATVAKEADPRTINFSHLKADKPLTRKKSDDKIGKKETVTYFDEENKDKRTKEEKELSKEDEKLKNMEILASLKAEKGKFDKKMEKIEEKKQTSLDDDMLFGMSGMVVNNEWANMGSFEKQPTASKKEAKYEHEEEIFDPSKEYPDFTYLLYAVLIHSGGSYGGHYFAYISDGTDWFRFDDSTVTKVDRSDMRKYGVNSNSTIGMNAYLLFYRDVKTFKEMKNLEIPKELLEKIKFEEEKMEELRKKDPEGHPESGQSMSTGRMERLKHLQRGMIIRVFKDSTEEPFLLRVTNKTEETIGSLREQTKQHFSIIQKEENWRLRRYNKSCDSVYEAYKEEQATFQQLDFGEQLSMMLQFKKDDEVFEDYDPKKIILKINVWQPDVIMIVDRKLKSIKIPILEENTFEELNRLIVKATGIETPLVIKRNFTRSNAIEKITLENSKDKKLIELKFFNNLTIYVEEQSTADKAKWEVEFENERHRCLIKFNNPKDSEDKQEEFYFDTRKTLGNLKTELSKAIEIGEDNFRIKKGKNALSEMTTYKKKLCDLRFINTEHLYLEEGPSSKGSVLVHRGEVGLVSDKIEFNIFEALQFELGSDLTTVSDLCSKISSSTGFPVENIRVREYKNFEFKEIFTPSADIHRIRQKSLIWEWVESQLPKGLQIYYRTFSILTFEFGPIQNLYADSSSSYEELAFMIEEETGIQNDRILMWKPLSNYIEKEYMLDVDWLQIRFVQATLKDEPLLIRSDGEILIIKEAEQAYKPSKVRKVAPEVKSKGEEAQLKITVIAENNEEKPVAENGEEAVVEKESPAEKAKE